MWGNTFSEQLQKSSSGLKSLEESNAFLTLMGPWVYVTMMDVTEPCLGEGG